MLQLGCEGSMAFGQCCLLMQAGYLVGSLVYGFSNLLLPCKALEHAGEAGNATYGIRWHHMCRR